MGLSMDTLYKEDQEVDTLYRGEQEEMDFLDSFMDYDSISIMGPDREAEQEDEEELEEDNEEVEGEEEYSETAKRRPGLRERMRWLTSRGRLGLRSLGSSGSLGAAGSLPSLPSLGSSRERLSTMKRGLARSRDRIHTAFR